MTKRELIVNIFLFLYIMSINTLMLFRVMNILIICLFFYEYFVVNKLAISQVIKRIYYLRENDACPEHGPRDGVTHQCDRHESGIYQLFPFFPKL